MLKFKSHFNLMDFIIEFLLVIDVDPLNKVFNGVIPTIEIISNVIQLCRHLTLM